MTTRRRRKLDQYLRVDPDDPELVLQAMAQLSNRLFRLAVGMGLSLLMAFLMVWPVPDRMSPPAALGVTVLVLLANILAWLAMVKAQPRVFERPSTFNQLAFLICLTVGLSWFIFQFKEWSPYLAPLPMLAMVLAITFGQGAAFMVVPLVGFYMGLLSPPEARPAGSAPLDVALTITLTMGGVVAVLGMARVRQQSRPFMVGAYAGLVQGAVVLILRLMGVEGPPLTLAEFETIEKARKVLVDPGWALTGGLVSGAAVTCLLPFLERVFKVVTERRLLALHDPNNRLLKALQHKAPGTYTHSLRVADLAAAAAEAIGADSLLARVGAYYHDIGKLTKPEYFVENVGPSGMSIHDRLRPSMSKLVIISHVKEGVELAEEEKLPQKIIDMIPMHHGTTVVEYFYHKARVEGDAAEPEVEYRYPGPRPRFREAGILMLADGVEATAKTIAEPNPSRFRDLVHQMVLKRLLDHQLDECDLTMRDLTRIEDSFVRTLTYMHHGRIKYPEKETASAAATTRAARRLPAAGVGDTTVGQGVLPRGGDRAYETRGHHRQPAEVSSAKPAPLAKDAFRDPSSS